MKRLSVLSIFLLLSAGWASAPVLVADPPAAKTAQPAPLPPPAAPPTLEIPAEVPAVGEYATVRPTTNAVSVLYVAQSGVSAFPSEFLSDKRVFILPVRGLAVGRYRFTAVAASVTGDQIATEFVVVVGTPPPVPPGPGPGPGPAPAPDGPLGLTKASREGAAKVPAGPDKAAQQAKLAAAQRQHASAVAAGAFTTPATILAGWRAANNAAVPAAAWSAWATDVSAALQALYTAGKLPDKLAWSEAFLEMAVGLGG